MLDSLPSLVPPATSNTEASRMPARAHEKSPWLGGPAFISSGVRLPEPVAPGHEARHEDDHYHQAHLHMVEHVEHPGPRGVGRLAPTQLDSPADESRHRPDLQGQDEREEGELHPEEAGGQGELSAPVEAAEG